MTDKMIPAPAPLSNAELSAYAAEHENAYVRQYVEALCDEHAELTNQLNETVRRGYSQEARDVMLKVGRTLLVVAVTLIAYFVGRSSN